MKKCVKLLLAAAVLSLLGICLLYIFDDNASEVVFKEGDAFTGMKVFDTGGNEKDISTLSDKKKIILFVWEKCGSCIAGFENYASLVSQYDNQGADIIFIWSNNIPAGLGSKPLGSTKHYAARNIAQYTKWVPAYYIVDENNTVLKITEDFQRVEEYLSVQCFTTIKSTL